MVGRNCGTDDFECCEPGLPDLARTAPQGHDVERQAGLTLLDGNLPRPVETTGAGDAEVVMSLFIWLRHGGISGKHDLMTGKPDAARRGLVLLVG